MIGNAACAWARGIVLLRYWLKSPGTRGYAMKIIDAHQHLWDLSRFSYAWLQAAEQESLATAPTLRRSYLLDDYRIAAAGLEIEQSVHLEADVDASFMLDEARWVLQMAEAARPLSAVVASARPESPAFPRYLDQLAGAARLKGLRRILHTQPDELSAPPLFAENLRRLPAYGLSFDLCVLARQLPIALRLIRACPEVAFILDHCGVPRVKERELDPWRGYIREIAREPNVVCKVSGVVAYADPRHWTPADLRPYIEHVIECFGWDRVLFGSDWPVCTLSATLRQWVEALEELTRAAGEANRQRLFYLNAAKVYRLDIPVAAEPARG